MPENNPDNTETPKTATPDNGVPEIEDACDPGRETEPVEEKDAPRQPDHDPRANDDGNSETAIDVESAIDAKNETNSANADADDSGDTAADADDSSDTAADADHSGDTTADADDSSDTATDAREPEPKPFVPDWSNETSARRIIVELKRIESDVRTIIEGRDWKRKRKLGGTRQWLILEEDILTWRHSGRFDETALDRLHELVGKRHYLFKRLRFIAATRPTWNT